MQTGALILCLGLTLSLAKATDLDSLPEPLKTVTQNYLLIQDKLALDQFDGVTAAAKAIQAEEPAAKNPPFLSGFNASVDAVVKAPDINSARLAFQKLSANIIAALAMAKAHTGKLHVAHCPMIKADWVQMDGTTIHNPYYGSAMPDCGVFTTVY